MVKDSTYFMSKSFDGFCWYVYLWYHPAITSYAPYDSVSQEGEPFRYMGDFGLFL